MIYSCAIIKMVDPSKDDNQNQAMMDIIAGKQYDAAKEDNQDVDDYLINFDEEENVVQENVVEENIGEVYIVNQASLIYEIKHNSIRIYIKY